MQIVSIGDNLHEISKPVYLEKYCPFVICSISLENGKGYIQMGQRTLNVVKKTSLE